MLDHCLEPLRRCCVAYKAPCIKDGDCHDEGTNQEEIIDEFNVSPHYAEVVVDGRHISGKLPLGPKERVISTFAIAEGETSQGAPLRTGTVLQLELGRALRCVNLSLYVNGFSIVPACMTQRYEQPDGVLCRVWSPFSLVEKAPVVDPERGVFKLTVFTREHHDRYFEFATTGVSATEDRDLWVNDITEAIRQVTLSLFPPVGIVVRPLPGVQSTCTRIMAGYLLQYQSDDTIALFYCELQAYSCGEACLATYKDEWCEREHSSFSVTVETRVSTRTGSYCTSFGLDKNRFCARTVKEKDLWLRALSNIKVKLMFDAPDPTDEELAIFRLAVLERVVDLEESYSSGAQTTQGSWDPMLARVPRTPLKSPRGDV